VFALGENKSLRTEDAHRSPQAERVGEGLLAEGGGKDCRDVPATGKKGGRLNFFPVPLCPPAREGKGRRTQTISGRNLEKKEHQGRKNYKPFSPL